MNLYVIENNINFYDELNKEEEEEKSNDDLLSNKCLITQLPLEEKHITLVCGHKFNYDAIFNDIYNHKKKFYDLESSRLKEYQIRCPYCRNIQNSLLPLYPGKSKVHGVNVNENLTVDAFKLMKNISKYHVYYKHYEKGICCHDIKNIPSMLLDMNHQVKCGETMVKYNSIDGRVYCKKHLKEMTENYFENEKIAISYSIKHERKLLTKIKIAERKIINDKKKITNKILSLEKTYNNFKQTREVIKKDVKCKKTMTDSLISDQENVIVSTESPVDTDNDCNKDNNCIAHTCSTNTTCKRLSIPGSLFCQFHKNMIS